MLALVEGIPLIGILMQNRREAILTQPALIPIAGAFDRKPRVLERDVTTVGRARGSDLCLEANEISTLHCILYRSGDVYRIRDCNSRCGTRVNGEAVKTHTLHDGDIVNLGPFSFEFRSPPALFPKDTKIDPARIEHWKRSRKKLAQIALRMRKRAAGKSPREEEWAHKAHLLKEKLRSYDQRARELEEAEKELSAEREELAHAREAHERSVQAKEGELARQFEEAEREIHRKWQAFQQRCRAEEARTQMEAGHPPSAAAVDEAVAQLKRDADAERQRLRDLEEHLNRQQEFWQREQEEFTIMKEQWVKAQTKSSEALQEQQAALALQEAGVRAQKAELVRMMTDLKKLQDDVRAKSRGDASELQAELDRVRQENAELRASLEKAALAPAPSSQDEVQRQIGELRAEVELLNEELLNKEQILLDLQSQHADNGDLVKVRAENEALKKELDSATAPKTENDLERYETELNEYRRQLENDRVKFNEEVETLRERNQELDEAVREMEMEMSKERAELARERMRLERVREEIKADSERLQRELAVRDSMASVQKLREEITQRPGVKPLNDRLRSMRGSLTDSNPVAGS